jgi:hypothetical protein
MFGIEALLKEYLDLFPWILNINPITIIISLNSMCSWPLSYSISNVVLDEVARKEAYSFTDGFLEFH